MIRSSVVIRSLMIKPLVMRRFVCFSGLLLLALGMSLISPGPAAGTVSTGTAEEGLGLEIIAPEGSDLDLEKEYFSYFGSSEQPVIMRNPKYSLTARRIDYDRKQQELTARGDVFLVSEEMELRAEKLLVELERESLTATGGFTLTTGEMELTGRMLTASLLGGVLTATEEINWRFRDFWGKAEQLVYRKDEEKVYLSGTPVAYLGENYIEGTMMVLHLETGRIIITGPVKSKMQPQGGGTGVD